MFEGSDPEQRSVQVALIGDETTREAREWENHVLGGGFRVRATVVVMTGMATRAPSRRAPVASHPRTAWRGPVVILIAGMLAYGTSLNGPFLFDDDFGIVSNERIRSLTDVADLLAPVRESPVAGRPLVNLSFALNYAWGGLDVRGYHVVNLAIHLACALLVFAIVQQTLRLPSLRARWGGRSADVALAIAVLWVVHPLTSEVVAYTVQRTESLMALCYLLTVYASVRGVPDRVGWQVVAMAACALGMASKESMVTAPIAVLLYDGAFVFHSWREAIERRWRWYLGLALTWGVLVALVQSGPRMYSAGFSTGVSPWTYLLNQVVLVTRYLRLAVWPRGFVLFYGPPVSLRLADVLGRALLLVILLVGSLLALRVRPILGFLGAWVFLTLAPTSSILPIATEVGAERRMYLPLIALIVVAVVGISQLWDQASARWDSSLPTRLSGRVLAAALLIVVTGALAVDTMTRTREYASPLQMAQSDVARWPTGGAHYMVGVELARLGRHDEAAAEYRQATSTFPRAHFNLAGELAVGHPDEALTEYATFIQDEPLLAEVIPAHLQMARICLVRQQWADVVTQGRQVLSMTPTNLDAQMLLAEGLAGAHAFDDAITHFQIYLRARPNDLAAVTDLGLAFVDSDRLPEAEALFRRAVALAPQDGAVRANLARTLLLRDQVEDAAREAQIAVTLEPTRAAHRALLGRAWAMAGHLEEARAEYLRAVQLDPTDAQAHQDLQRLNAFMAQGRTPGATAGTTAPPHRDG